MKAILFTGLLAVTVFASTAFALTQEREVTADYLKNHSEQFSVTVTKTKAGLIEFSIKHNVPRPMYHVAHLAIDHDGKLISDINMPSFGRKHDNEFDFALAPEDIAGSKFDLSDSAVGGTGEDATPEPGTIIYNFHLADFVPAELRSGK
ncbi:MAG TPA: hypothetical protein VFE46_04745 [Pirellulales bacterium]|jgi:hypothetical protein|nr:hypothetical protein [Pirellulales bacterium]